MNHIENIKRFAANPRPAIMNALNSTQLYVNYFTQMYFKDLASVVRSSSNPEKKRIFVKEGAKAIAIAAYVAAVVMLFFWMAASTPVAVGMGIWTFASGVFTSHSLLVFNNASAR